MTEANERLLNSSDAFRFIYSTLTGSSKTDVPTFCEFKLITTCKNSCQHHGWRLLYADSSGTGWTVCRRTLRCLNISRVQLPDELFSRPVEVGRQPYPVIYLQSGSEKWGMLDLFSGWDPCWCPGRAGPGRAGLDRSGRSGTKRRLLRLLVGDSRLAVGSYTPYRHGRRWCPAALQSWIHDWSKRTWKQRHQLSKKTRPCRPETSEAEMR